MIISKNKKPTLEDFRTLMSKTDDMLNAEAISRESYYAGRNGTKLEKDVFDALNRCAKDTPFENTIELVSGAAFPDIVASHFYGVEVKSTNKNHWKSIGSSILESTRNQDVKRIFLTFGKLAKPIAFMSRPYEECLSGISVTHYPRYQIDMKLGIGETIFDKLGISYDKLRKMDNPVAPVSNYYKEQLKPGESLWWVSGTDVEENAVPPTVRLWNALSCEEKNYYTVQGYVFFPEILGHSRDKHEKYALWLVINKGIVNTNIRDQFSAGGKVNIVTANRVYEGMPAAFGRIKRYKDLIIETVLSVTPEILKEYWGISNLPNNRMLYWCKRVANYAGSTAEEVRKYNELLLSIFNL